MADTETAPAPAPAPAPAALHPPGIWLDMDMQEYIDDPGVSGSGWKKLILSPADFKWELPGRNPLYTPPTSDDRALGTLVHCAVLEGWDVFEHRYFVAPEFDDADPRLIRTSEDAANWLADQGSKKSGNKAERFERVAELARHMREEGAAEDALPIFPIEIVEKLRAMGNGRREQIKQKAFDYVQVVAQVAASAPPVRALLQGGLAEVSIFWTEGGVRYKARVDYLTFLAVVDVKKFGTMPKRGRSLFGHLQDEAWKYYYDVQAVHNMRAALQLPLLLAAGVKVHATGPDADERVALLHRLAAEYAKHPPTFTWVWLRTPGPPQCAVMPFPSDSGAWRDAEWDIREIGLPNLLRYRKECGDELDPEKPWVEFGTQDWDDDLRRPYQMAGSL